MASIYNNLLFTSANLLNPLGNIPTQSSSNCQNYTTSIRYSEPYLPIYLNRHDFKYLYLVSQKPTIYIRNTIYNNGIDMNGYWTKFKVYNELNELIDPSTYTFILSSNAQQIKNTQIQSINNLDPQILIQTNEIVDIYNSCFQQTSIDNNPISLTLQLSAKQNIQKINISHLANNTTYQTNIVEISVDNVNWETIYDSTVDGTYTELYDGKNFYTFSPENIIFTTVNNNIVPIEDIPIIQSVCYTFDPDDNYQFYGIKNSDINGNIIILSNIYMWYQNPITTWPNIKYQPISELSIDFEHTDYDIDIDNNIYTDEIRFYFSSLGQEVNEIEIYDVFNNNLILNLAPQETSNNLNISLPVNIVAWPTLYYLTDGIHNDNNLYTEFYATTDGNQQYITFKLSKKFKINNIKIYFTYQNDFSQTFNVIRDFSCLYKSENGNWETIYSTQYDGVFSATYNGKNLLLQKSNYYKPHNSMKTQYIRYWISNVTLSSYNQILPMSDNLFLPTLYNQNDYRFNVSPNLSFLDSNNNEIDYITQLTDYYNQYFIQDSNPSQSSYIIMELPYVMNLEGLIFTSPSSYISRIETSYNQIDYNIIYDINLNLNQPTFLSTYTISNYQNKQNNGLLYTTSKVIDQVTLDSKESYIIFNNVQLFENKNKILLIDGQIYTNMYNFGQLRYFLQTQNLTISYYTYPYQGLTYYELGVSYIDVDNINHSQNYIVNLEELNISSVHQYYLPIFFEFDINSDNTFNYYFGTQQHTNDLDLPRIVQIGTATNSAQIDTEAYLILGNTTITRQDNVLAQSEISISDLHLLDL